MLMFFPSGENFRLLVNVLSAGKQEGCTLCPVQQRTNFHGAELMESIRKKWRDDLADFDLC